MHSSLALYYIILIYTAGVGYCLFVLGLTRASGTINDGSTLSFYKKPPFWSRVATRFFVAMSKYQSEQTFFNQRVNSILSKLGKEFDSNNFITAFKDLYPIEYATALQNSGSYRQFHAWISRWYLNGLANEANARIRKGGIRSRKSTNGNTTRNRIWMQ